jgi:glycosyltransferase involved in cell wall biosynthesis
VGLEKTLTSVAQQTHKDIQYVIIDGASTDGSEKLLETFEYSNAVKISEPDSGIYNAMNKGIRQCTGDYLLFLNSGDTLRDPQAIEDIIPNLKGNKDLYYGELAMQGGLEDRIKTYPEQLDFYYFFSTGSLPHPALFFKKSLFDDIGFYREKFKIVGDWDFYVNALFKHQATYQRIDRVISNFDTDGISSNPKQRDVLLAEKDESLRDNFPRFYDDYKLLHTLRSQEKQRVLRILREFDDSKYGMRIFLFFVKIWKKIFKK